MKENYLIKKRVLWAYTLQMAHIWEKKIMGKAFPFDYAAGDLDFEVKTGINNEKVYKITYWEKEVF